MTDDKLGPNRLTAGAPNAREVQAAQEAADEHAFRKVSGADAHEELLHILVEVRAVQEAAGSPVPSEVSDKDAHKEFLHILTTTYGINGVRRMLDKME